MINLKAAIVGFALIIFIVFILLRKIKNRKAQIGRNKEKIKRKKRNKKK